MQFPVFYLLGGVGAVAGGILANSEHLDSLAIGEWSVAGLIGPPAFVCLVIFCAIRWHTPTKQRNEARKALAEKNEQIAELTTRVQSLASAEASSTEPRQQISIGTVERLELHGEQAELLTAKLIDRFEVGEAEAANEPQREPQARLEPPPNPAPETPPSGS